MFFGLKNLIDENKIKIEKFKEGIKTVESRGIKELVAELDNFNERKAKGIATLGEELTLRRKIETSPISIANPFGTIAAYKSIIAKIKGLEEKNEEARGQQRTLIRRKEAVENQKNMKTNKTWHK